MDNNERKLFWDKLNSVDGKDLVADYTEIVKTITYPKYLFRFRPMTEFSLGNLRTNTLYFSNAADYDDPFDSYIHIDKKQLSEKLDSVLKSFEDVEKIKMVSKQIIGTEITDEGLRQIDSFGKETMMAIVDRVLKNVRFSIRENDKSVCFSEDSTNRSLWLKYAQNHRGYCLVYDIEDLNNCIIGNKDWVTQLNNNELVTLYPVYYSNEKLDATQYIELIIALIVIEELERINNPYASFFRAKNEELGNGKWWSEKIALIKEYAHNQDKEWRALVTTTVKGTYTKTVKPYAIIFGLRTTETDKVILKALAKEAGIERIYQATIDDNDELVYQELIED